MMTSQRQLVMLNQKGGTAKSTTAVNVAAALGERNRRVLLWDLDYQCNASQWLGADDGGIQILEVFLDDRPIKDLIQPTSAAGVDLVPASEHLMGADLKLSEVMGKEFAIQRALVDHDYDYVIFDCPADLGVLPVNALAAASEVIVPVATHVMELAGLRQLTKTVDTAQKRLNPGVHIAAVLACRFDDRNNLCRAVLDSLERHFPDKLLKTIVHENIKIAESYGHEQSILDYQPKNRGADEFRTVAAEIEALAL